MTYTDSHVSYIFLLFLPTCARCVCDRAVVGNELVGEHRVRGTQLMSDAVAVVMGRLRCEAVCCPLSEGVKSKEKESAPERVANWSLPYGAIGEDRGHEAIGDFGCCLDSCNRFDFLARRREEPRPPFPPLRLR